MANRPLTWFFGLTYGLSWTIWLSEPVVARYDPVGSEWYGRLGAYGPTGAAIALTALLGARPAGAWGRGLLAGGLALAAAAWVNWGGAAAIADSPQPLVAGLLWLALTALPALMVLLAWTRAGGLGAPLAWRLSPGWYALALGVVPVAGLAGMVLVRSLGGPWPPFPHEGPLAPLAGNLLLGLMGTILYGGGLAEEPGWRGFALPRLQATRSPLGASAALAAAWSLWLLPLHVLGASGGEIHIAQAVIIGLSMRIFSILPICIVATWLANGTGGNLLMLVLMHAAVDNTAGWWLPNSRGLYLGVGLLAVVLVLLDRMWRLRGPAAPLPPARP